MNKDELIKIINKAAKEKFTTLDLSSKKITELLPEIGQLTNLKRLDVYNNQLSSLPKEIGQLTNLKVLYLFNNQLSSLPEEISQLKNLQVFSAFNNRLSSFPNEIGQLTNLQELIVSDNQLSSLPKEIGQLTNLQVLIVSDNQLSSLPKEIGQLTNLKKLYLTGNNLPIPSEIIEQNSKPQEIINYYLKHQETVEKKALNEVKMILVGQGSVGKTSVVNRLVHDTFNKNEGKTKGIDICDWGISIKGDKVKIHTWDFGGQEIMHATHQFFMTERSLYILVLDARKGEQDCKVEYWLKLIKSYGGDSPIIVAINQIDEGQLHIDRKGLQNKYGNIKAFIETSCKDRTGIDELRSLIADTIENMEHVTTEWLSNWFNVKTKLEELKKKENQIPLVLYTDICKEEEIDELSKKTLLRYLHDLGIVLSFVDDPRLKDKNILNPEWITDAVYQIINSNDLFKSNGILEVNNLKTILNKQKYPEDTFTFIIDIMLKFELCFEFEGQKNQYLIPDLLPEESHDINWDYTDTLRFQIQYSFLPGSVISRFIVKTHNLISENTYWRTGVLLKRNGNKALIIADLEDKKIDISITGNVNTRRELLAIIRNHLDYIRSTIKGLEPKEFLIFKGVPISYVLLRENEDMRVEEIVVEGLKEKANVKMLLDGIETPEKRILKDKEKYPDRYQEQMINNLIDNKIEETKTKKNNPWISGSFYLVTSVLLLVILEIIFSDTVSYIKHPISIIGSLLIVCVVGAFQLKNDDKLKDESFTKLMIEVLKRLSLIKAFSNK